MKDQVYNDSSLLASPHVVSRPLTSLAATVSVLLTKSQKNYFLQAHPATSYSVHLLKILNNYFPCILAMGILNLILSSVFAIYVVAAPTGSELRSPLTVPVPGSTTYDADVAVAVAYARSQPSFDTVKVSATTPKQRMCGEYKPANRPGSEFVYSTGGLLCAETEHGEEMERFTNYHCGVCMVFDGKCGGHFLFP